MPAGLAADVARAKGAAVQRQAIEAEIPPHLLFTSGWPTVRPTPDEAELLASVRQRVGDLIGLDVNFTHGADVRHRYDELLAQRSPDVPTVTAPAQAAFAF